MSQPVSQVAVNETARLIERFDLLLEDVQRTVSKMTLELEGSIARLSGRRTVQCSKCRVTVDIEKVNLPNRCMSKDCPLKPQEQKNALYEIMGHLGAAKMQRAPSDDQIIAEHIDDALDIATKAYSSIKD